MKVAVKKHYSQDVKALTDISFDWDPYCGMFWEELADQLEEDYKTLDGCRDIISGYIEFMREVIADREGLVREINELKRGVPNDGVIFKKERI